MGFVWLTSANIQKDGATLYVGAWSREKQQNRFVSE